MKLRKVVHIMSYSVFTDGYVQFMKTKMKECKHAFIIYIEENNDKGIDESSVFYISSWLDLKLKSINKWIEDANCIVISGAFNVHKFFWLLDRKIRNKTYIQFWGGDFYDVFRGNAGIKRRIKRFFIRKAVRDAQGLLFLQEGEKKQFENLTGISKKSFVAPMVADPKDYDTLMEIRCAQRKSAGGIVNILLGNSATESNHHFEMIDAISKLSFEKKVFCPLSYGNKKYGEEVMLYGRERLGNCFEPILEHMTRKDYWRFLSGCDVGIFNNDRQQALGNIYALLFFGKKVYIRSDISTWEALKKEGFYLFDISNISKIESRDELIGQDKDMVIQNNLAGEKSYKQIDAIQSWSRVIYDQPDDLQGKHN